MSIIKLYTQHTFNNEGFAELLRYGMDVKAVAVRDGVILDKTAFNQCKLSDMPVWAFNNRKHINSLLRTGEATEAEIELCNKSHEFQLVGATGTVYETSNNLNKLLAAGLALKGQYTMLSRKYYIQTTATGKRIATI